MAATARYTITAVDRTKAAFDSFERRMRNATRLMRGFAGLAAGAAIAKSMQSVVDAASTLEQQMLKIEGVLRATGNVSGLTAREIDELARSIGEATLASERDARDAAAALLTFRSISGETFKQTLRLAQDLASLGFGNLKTATVQLAKALEDPATGLSQLRRVGVSFTRAQRDMIVAMSEAGDVAGAQAEILKVLEQQVGGAGAAEGQGMAGAVDLLGQRWRELLEALGKTGPMQVAKRWIDGLTDSIERFRKAVAPTNVERFMQLSDEIGRLQERLLAVSDRRARNAINRRIMALKTQLDLLAKELQRMTNEESKRKANAEKAAAMYREQARAEKERQQRIDEARMKAERLQKAMDRVFPERAKFRQMAEDLEIIRKKYGEASVEFQEAAKRFADATGGPRKLRKEVTNLKEESDKLGDAARDIGNQFSTSFEDAILRARKLSDAMRELGNYIAKVFLRETVTKPLGNAVTDFVGSINWGSVFGGARASGGPVLPGKAYLVGEQGPELFFPGRSGAIVPNGAVGAGVGTVVINQSFDFSGANPATVQLLRQESARIVQAAVAAVQDAYNRRGKRGPMG